MIDTDEMMAISVNDANIILLLIPNARTTYCTTRTFHLFPREKIEFSKGTYHGRRVKFASKTCDYMIVGEEVYLLRSNEVCVRPLHHFLDVMLILDGDVKPQTAAQPHVNMIMREMRAILQ